MLKTKGGHQIAPTINHIVDFFGKVQKFNAEIVPVGHFLSVTTRSGSVYNMTRISSDSLLFSVIGSGNYIKKPTNYLLSGSTFGGSVILLNHICIGMRLELVLFEKPKTLTTSSVTSLKYDGRRILPFDSSSCPN